MTEHSNKQAPDSGIIEFDDYSPGEVITVTLEGTSRKGLPYRTIHKLKAPDAVQLRKYNNRLSQAELESGRRRKRSRMAIRTDTQGASEWLWSQLVVEVHGYKGGIASVPPEHKVEALNYVLPEPVGSEEDEQE